MWFGDFDADQYVSDMESDNFGYNYPNEGVSKRIWAARRLIGWYREGTLTWMIGSEKILVQCMTLDQIKKAREILSNKAKIDCFDEKWLVILDREMDIREECGDNTPECISRRNLNN